MARLELVFYACIGFVGLHEKAASCLNVQQELPNKCVYGSTPAASI
jgi:hypothetical protein